MTLHPEFISANILEADDDLRGRVDVNDAGEHLELVALRIHSANLLDPGQRVLVVQRGEINRGRFGSHQRSSAKVARRSAADSATHRRSGPLFRKDTAAERRTTLGCAYYFHSTNSNTCGSSVIIASGRIAGSWSCSGVAARLFLSPA